VKHGGARFSAFEPAVTNDEAKTRRKTKFQISEKARVMTREDIGAEEARRAEQEASLETQGKRSVVDQSVVWWTQATADKGKRRKRQRVAQEAEKASVV
jgi:hypothetical protein